MSSRFPCATITRHGQTRDHLGGASGETGFRVDPDLELGPRSPRNPRNGITDPRTIPPNRAHAFRMTRVAQGKLTYIRSYDFLKNSKSGKMSISKKPSFLNLGPFSTQHD